MKGVIFSEFMSMVEDQWDIATLNSILEDANDPIKGAYVGVGNYSYQNLVSLVGALNIRSGIPGKELLQIFGKYLFEKLFHRYPYISKDFHSSFELLENIETVIHAEVKKLYQDSQPPKIGCERVSDTVLKMTYSSHRCMAPVAVGLMHGCAEYFHDKFDIKILKSSKNGDHVEFLVTKQDVNG